MKRSGSNNRQRRRQLCARFNEQEAAAIRQAAEGLGLPLSAYVRSQLLSAPASRAARRPTVSHEVAARLLGELGRISETLRAAANTGDLTPSNPVVAAALRDLAEMRAVCFQAMGRAP